MTPRKEIYIAIKEVLKAIPEMDFVDYHRNQFDNGEDSYPSCFTACLIRINRVDWVTMTQEGQQGETTVDVVFYCLDGYLDQYAGTGDDESGLIEIELIDDIADTLQFLKGDQFKPLEQISDEPDEISPKGTMSYTLSFKTMLYRKTPSNYTRKKITLTKN